jgi:hypothetical protein
MMTQIIGWLSKLDPETTVLFRRFMAKAFSQENPNEYIKRVLRAELNTIDTVGKDEIDHG